MIYERNGLLLEERTEPQEDQELFDSLSTIVGGKEAYSYLTLPADRKKDVAAAWHEGENASLSVEPLNEDDYFLKLAALKQWKMDLISREDIDADTKQVYRWKVNEHIANVNMLIASSKGDMKNFQRWNEFIYGKPDEATYRAALDWVAHDAEELIAKSDQHPAVTEAAERTLAMLSDKRGYRELLVPDPEVFRAVRDDHMSPEGYYGLLLAGVQMPEGKVTRDIGDPILEQVIKNIGSDKPIKDATGSTWGVNDEAVLRPAQYNMILKRFIGLGLGHEIGSHELERTNGKRGPLALLSEGLDRFELGNEGRAVIREQVPYETFDQFGKILRWRDILRRHIAISFGAGVGADQPASSSETHDFMSIIDQMYKIAAKPEDVESAMVEAQKRTDDLLARVLKGTDGEGGAYYKDKVYLEGHVSNWLEAAMRGPGAISDGDLGKFDISNHRHLLELQKRGLLPTPE